MTEMEEKIYDRFLYPSSLTFKLKYKPDVGHDKQDLAKPEWESILEEFIAIHKSQSLCSDESIKTIRTKVEQICVRLTKSNQQITRELATDIVKFVILNEKLPERKHDPDADTLNKFMQYKAGKNDGKDIDVHPFIDKHEFSRMYANISPSEVLIDSIPELLQETTDCPICLEQMVMNNPCMLTCGHTICWKCLGTLKVKSSCVQCPICQKPHNSKNIYLNLPLVYMIRNITWSLQATCPAVQFGCTWTGRFGNLFDHMFDCQHSTLVCKFCTLPMEHKYLLNHIKDDCIPNIVTCEDCHQPYFSGDSVNHKINYCFPYTECQECNKYYRNGKAKYIKKFAKVWLCVDTVRQMLVSIRWKNTQASAAVNK
jgi:hypothetical protein